MEVFMSRLSVLVVCSILAAASLASADPPRTFSVEVSGNGPPVVLIPGLACSGEVWASTVALEKARAELHVVSLAGFGGQPAVAVDGPFLDRVRDELVAYIREHKLERPLLVGHSLGGFVALAVAEREPDLVGGVLIVDALPFLPVVFGDHVTVESVKPQAEQMRRMTVTSTPEAFARQNRDALAAMVTAPADLELLARIGARSDPATVGQAMYELLTTDLRLSLGRVKAPVTVLAAGVPDGAEATRKIFASSYAGLKGVKLVVVDRARHFIQMDAPAAFRAELERMIGSAK
jgi:N-formylmaleamate deformylase